MLVKLRRVRNVLHKSHLMFSNLEIRGVLSKDAAPLRQRKLHNFLISKSKTSINNHLFKFRSKNIEEKK